MPPDSADNNQSPAQSVAPQTATAMDQSAAAPPPAATMMPAQQPAAAQNTGTESSAKPADPNSTQNSLQIAEIREGMVIMKDSSYRAVIECESINFDLMSGEEREGVEYSYQSFLNSLDFPIQILIRSQRVDIGPYVEQLSSLRRDQDNMLLSVLMDDYIDFIDILSQEANIMDKSFYIVVPFYPAGDVAGAISNSKGFFKQLFSKQENQTTKISAQSYAKAKEELANRINLVRSGLRAVGINNQPLDTNQLSRLYYNSYNPDIAFRQPLGNPEDLSSVYVKKNLDQEGAK